MTETKTSETRSLWPIDHNPEQARRVVVSLDTLQALLVDHANTEHFLDSWFSTQKGI